MKPLRIEFAPNTLARALLSPRPIWWLSLACGIALCAATGGKAQALQAQIQVIEGQTRSLQSQRQRAAADSKRTPASATAAMANQVTAVNLAVAHLNVPWSAVFDAIEAATPASVALLSLEPDPTKLLLRGIGEARNSDDMLHMIEQLQRQDLFVMVTLTRHETSEQDPNRPVRFHFEAMLKRGAQ